MQRQSNCLIVVDMQYDFIHPKGSLYINDGETIIPAIEKLLSFFDWDLVIFTQDWHPINHVSFYTSHLNKNVGQSIMTQYGTQKLWPPHCIQNQTGAQIVESLLYHHPYTIIKKGYNQNVDSYSAFEDQSGRFKTGLDEILKSNDIIEVYICGVATNYCVKYTALHSLKKGYITNVIGNATATISQTLTEI